MLKVEAELCGAGFQPAADFQSASWRTLSACSAGTLAGVAARAAASAKQIATRAGLGTPAGVPALRARVGAPHEVV